ncbi:hypothetical protein G7Y89_g1432 [Cudoniella acicularis]|uniref:Uncharacterized protein n=1 Tax=Cudoniella acicularis TaxID=354080 RepID=A0A8H4RW34_9HELO|nr:hypothetical protein G7Y89_g1432 [Cudoniella acicularis]
MSDALSLPTQILANGLPYTYVRPPCECDICAKSFRDSMKQSPPSGWSYSLELSESQARSIAARHLKNIYEDLGYLRQQWSACGKTIVSRWKKKSRDKRAVCLKAADGNLFEQQWFAPLFTSKQLKGSKQGDAREYRKLILLDYVNVDGLKGDLARLLGLLQNRTRYGPETWALHDSKKLDWCWNAGLADIDGSRLCMIMHGPRYGELVEWEERAAHAREMIGFPRARLVLEAQENLYKFLRRVIEQLVEGIKQEISPQNTFQDGQLEFKRSGRIDLWSTYINQPYSRPPVFSIETIHSKALARFNMISDHIWLLQTDPGYLRRVIRVAAEGYPPDHPIEDTHKYTASEIHYDIWTYWSWAFIVEACQNVKEMQHKFSDNIYPGQPLPPKYEQVLQELELLLESQMRTRSNPLPMLLSFRPGFRQYFNFDYSNPDQVAVTGMVDVPNLLKKDPLFYILHILPEDPTSKEPGNYDIITKWSFLEDQLANTTHSDASRLDEKLYDRYNDYAAVHELFLSVHFHLPMPPLLETLNSYKRAAIRELGRPTVFRDQIEKITEEEYMLPHDYDASNALLRFTRVFDSHLTKSQHDGQMRLEQFDATRAAMSNFWAVMRRKRQSIFKQKKFWTFEDITSDLKVISADMEPEYKTLIATERKKIVDRIDRLSGRPQVSGEASQTEWGSTPSGLDTAKPALKPKTRPEPSGAVPDIESLSVEATEPSQAASIPVKAPTLRILSMMFSTAAEGAAKLVNWDDFVLAMQDVGFLARQTTGSEVVFQPEENERGWSGRINFHKPHPVAKIDRVMLRAMGKRMERWYGWQEGMFSLKQK